VELSFADFLEIIVHLRPENLATVLDIIEMRHIFSTYKKSIDSRILQLEGCLCEQGDLELNRKMTELFDEAAVLKEQIKLKSELLKNTDEDYRKKKRELEEKKRERDDQKAKKPRRSSVVKQERKTQTTVDESMVKYFEEKKRNSLEKREEIRRQNSDSNVNSPGGRRTSRDGADGAGGGGGHSGAAPAA